MFLSDIYQQWGLGSYPDIKLKNKNDKMAPFFVMFDFEIISGNVTISQIAYKNQPSKEEVLNCKDSRYVYGEGTFKGITEKSSEVICNFYYNIKEKNSKYINTRVFNLQNPMGYEFVPMWITHVNPQEDYHGYISSPESTTDAEGNVKEVYYSPINIGAESDILTLNYISDEKLSLYGDSIMKKNNKWNFSVYHDWLKSPKAKIIDSNNLPSVLDDKIQYKLLEKNELFIPNNIIKELSIENPMQTSSINCFDITGSTGNYLIKVTYDVNITNETEIKKAIEFCTNNSQNYIVEVYNCDTEETSVNYSNNIKNDYSIKPDRCICRFEIGPKKIARYKISITLVTGDPGTIRNYIKIVED